MVISLKDHWYGVTSAPPPKGGQVEIKHAFFEPLPTSIVFTLQNVGAENGGQLSTLDYVICSITVRPFEIPPDQKASQTLSTFDFNSPVITSSPSILKGS